MKNPAPPYLFVDVETTGLSREDRIVSLGAIELPSLELADRPAFDLSAIHLVFNPGRKSHPMARRVHGYSDAELANQDPFSQHAPALLEKFEQAETIIAHNASFDERFVRNAFFEAGLELTRPRFFCTMRAYRTQHEGSAALKAVLKKMGLSRKGKHHGALEDAWLAMQIFRWLNGYTEQSTAKQFPPPSNYKSGTTAPPFVADEAPRLYAPPSDTAAGKLSAFSQPAACLMMAVAKADQTLLHSELAVLYLMLLDVSKHLGLGDDPEMLGEVFAYFAQWKSPVNYVEEACQAIVADAFLSDNISGWLKQIAYADGEGSDAEAEMFLHIANHLRAARTAI